MQNFFRLFLIGAFLPFLSGSSLLAAPLKTDLQALADSYESVRGFTGSVIVARGDEILVKSSYGDADVEWSVSNSPTTKYRIGSLTKPITATLIMVLVEDETLLLSGTLGDYLPDLYAETAAASVTVEHLLSHTSGLPDLPRDFNDPWYQTTARLTFEPKDLAQDWIKPELLSEPGETFRYNNGGFVLLALIIEEATGQSYADNLKAHIFEPAGMTSSGVFDKFQIISNMAHGYERSAEGGLKHPMLVDPSIFAGAADIYSTVEDLHRFDRALYGDKLLSRESRVSMMSQKSNAPYGFGWGIENLTINTDFVSRVSSHSGSIPGYQSYYLRSETEEGFVFVTSNTNQGSIVPVMARDLMKVLSGKPMTLAKLDLLEYLSPILEAEGEEGLIKAYTGLGDGLSKYNADEGTLNRLGYQLLRLDMTKAALFIFESNVDRNPNAANPHDSLGEAYRSVGRVGEAIKLYEKALVLDPKSESAKIALAEMRETGK